VVQPQARKARVAVLSTGDETGGYCHPPPLPVGKIRNSNQIMLGALVVLRQVGNWWTWGHVG